MFLINAVLKSKALYNMLLKKAASAKNYEKNIPRTPKRKISINNEAIKKKTKHSQNNLYKNQN